ncbi:MAG: aminopeptidase P family protein [Clostridia bacterium]|nr:aminopeptidase P family protein [Clostridia bacterium]
MYVERLKKLVSVIPANATLIFSPENLYYFSGFTGGEGMLYIDKSRLLLFTDSRYTVQARDEAPDFEVIDTAQTSVSEFLKQQGDKAYGFEDDYVTFSKFASLKRISPKSVFSPVSSHIDKLRMIKDEHEISLIEKSASIADSAYNYILDKIAVGKTEREIALELEYFMLRQGAEGLSFDTIAASGIRSCMPHGTATDKVIESGDFLTLDFGCKYKGYCSDMTRTVVVGKANDKQKEIYNTVLSAQYAALNTIRAGELAKAVDDAARGVIENAGYGKHFGHGLGHSLGLKVHESPSCSPKSSDILTENMLMTVEPGIYIDDFGGVRIEDLVCVTNDGHRNLTTSGKDLIEL